MTARVLDIGDNDFSLPTLEHFWMHPVEVKLSERCRAGVEQSASIVAQAAAGEAAVYGINTGFGKLAQTRIDVDDTQQLQRNLILSHCAGTGEAVVKDTVRLMMLLKALSLVQGASGVRWHSIELLCEMINRDVIPVIPCQGSVGASGDLAQLAHMTSVMIGHGEAMFDDQVLPAAQALTKAGLKPIELQAKEGLAFINGTQYCTAQALVALFRARRLVLTSLVSGALSTDALMGSSAPFRPQLHVLRRQPGQIAAAHILRTLLSGSAIRESHRDDDERVQDPYSFRCQPQVQGACIDLLVAAGATLQREANAVTDNPLVIAEAGASDPAESILSGGNFHAEPVAFAADQMALALAETGAISQRRIATLVDPALNYGLPAFLSPNPGINSGFMIAEVTAAALMSENKHLASPCSVDSTPTSANQEDHVSMAAHAARRLHAMCANLSRIVAIEIMCAAQGIESRDQRTSVPLVRSVDIVRAHVPALEQDRELQHDIAAVAGLVDDAAFVAVVTELGLDDPIFAC